MPACPNCHVYNGLWSPLSEKDGVFVCKADKTHRYIRDREGNFHSAR